MAYERPGFARRPARGWTYRGRMLTQQQPRRPAEVTARGAARRRQLIDAGVTVLVREGWAGLTARAVAEEAQANAGLIHYHFGGLAALKCEVAAAAATQMFDPVVTALTGAPSWGEGVRHALGVVAAGLDGAAARLAGELVAASVQDNDVRRLLATALADARSSLLPWLVGTGVDERQAPGLATLLVAALDGLVLHALVDPTLPLSNLDDLVACMTAHEEPGRG